HQRLSVRRQCELLGLPRSTFYYEPVPESPANLKLMRLMDEQYLATPFYGSRRVTTWLRRQGHDVNRKRVQRLLRLMGYEAIYPKKRTTWPAAGQRIFPYLLRHLRVCQPDQVWSTDITYIPLRQGFLYLVAVMDWYSRYVLTWRLSNSLEGSFCLEALDAALALGQPEIFNSDQGSQFTSPAFTGRLQSRGVAVSMDGRGRALDNVFIERLWRSLKQENIYLKDYATGDEVYQGLECYFDFYNHERPHQGLHERTPAEVYQWGAETKDGNDHKRRCQVHPTRAWARA
ncbi:MAG: IS3 family transposase, partial [Acidobacteria bacterium]|nr:IS3 family transposase [Acidobacteriota bacterium]